MNLENIPFFKITKDPFDVYKWAGFDENQWNKIKKTKDTDWRYTNLNNEPITYNVNSCGYRTYEFKFDEDYIIVCGCSNTYGLYLHEEDRYSNIIEKITGIKTYNLGINGGSANIIMMNICTLLTSDVKKPKAIVIQWPKHMRLNFPYTEPYNEIRRLRVGEDVKTDKVLQYFLRNNSNPIETMNIWSKKYVTEIMEQVKIKNIQFAVDIETSNFFNVHNIVREDNAADDKHIGPRTNKKITNYILENLGNENV